MKRYLLLLLLPCLLVGCATTPSYHGYMCADIQEKYFKGVTDAKALDLFYKVYNEPVDNDVDRIAKDITVVAFLKALKARNSKEIENSGVFRTPHKKIELTKWTDDDLLVEYNGLIALSEAYEGPDYPDKKNAKSSIVDAAGRSYWTYDKDTEVKEEDVLSPEKEHDLTLEVIRLTAAYSIGNELARRDGDDQSWRNAGYAMQSATGMALQIASSLAGFMI